jgi:organic hydroperoxide reductase OsmC/OhrA
MQDSPSITLKQLSGYRFEIDFGSAFPAMTVDEPVPIGNGAGPCAEQLVIAAVANCLAASLAFALGKYRQEARGIEARSACRIVRNAEGRLRIAGIDVAIALGTEMHDLDRMNRVLAQFERFCTVSESIKAGIAVNVSITDRAGVRLR